MLSSEQLNMIYHIALDKGHACIAALGLSLSPCLYGDRSSADEVSLAPPCSEAGGLSPEEEDVVGAAETLAEHQTHESTSCLHLTRLSWVSKGLQKHWPLQ